MRRALIICFVVVGCGGANAPSTSAVVEPASETTVAKAAESKPVEPPSPECVWAQSSPNAPEQKQSTLQFGSEQYYEIGSRKPCDTVTVYIDTADQKDFDFATMSLARYNVLHSRQVRCRDGMLRLTAEKAAAMSSAC